MAKRPPERQFKGHAIDVAGIKQKGGRSIWGSTLKEGLRFQAWPIMAGKGNPAVENEKCRCNYHDSNNSFTQYEHHLGFLDCWLRFQRTI